MKAVLGALLLSQLEIGSSYDSAAVISASQWSALNDAIDGSVILPTDSNYADEYVLWTATYDNVEPEAIIECANEDDAVTVMKFLKENAIDDDGNWYDFRMRCCKHSLAGWSTSTGIIVSVINIDHLYVSDTGTAMVGPGVDLATFTAYAEENDFTLPHGDCSSVCFGGFLLGGGFGLTSRTFGMGIDWIKSINIVLPSGELVTASSDNEYSDLFWALRGAGQGNFGMVTSFEMNIPEKKQTNPGLYVEISWNFDSDTWDTVSTVWNEFASNTEYGNHFAMYMRINPTDWLSLEYSIQLHGFWTGEQVDGLMALAKLLEDIDITPETAKIDYVPFEGWIGGSATDRTRYASHCSSRFALNDAFDASFFDTLKTYHLEMSSFDDYDTNNEEESAYGIPSQFLFVAPAGGAISNHDSDETAFPHRDAKFFFNVCVRWMTDYENVKQFAENWLSDLMSKLENDGHLSTKSFINFPDNNIEKWEKAYYGDNYQKLREIKAKYDPESMFTFRYSVVPLGADFEDEIKRQESQELNEKSGDEKSRIQQHYENIEKILINPNINSSNGYSLPKHWGYYAIIITIAVLILTLIGFVTKRFIEQSPNSKANEYSPLNTQALVY